MNYKSSYVSIFNESVCVGGTFLYSYNLSLPKNVLLQLLETFEEVTHAKFLNKLKSVLRNRKKIVQ